MSILEGVNGTTCDAQQYQQGLLSLESLDPSITCLTRGQSIGLALVAEASLVSIICILIIFILIMRNILRYRKELPKGDWKLLQAHADIYMLSLFIFDLIQATGGLLNGRWAGNGQVTTGSYCWAQGIIKQIGALGTSMITLILAVHTFIAALWEKGIEARRFAFGIVGLVCVFATLWVSIGSGIHHQNYEVPTPYWCWMGPRFKGERLAGEYIWLWMALFASMVMYIALYLWAEGRLSIGDRWYKFRLHKPNPNMEYPNRQASLGMLFYPLAYSLMILPLSAARWSQGSHKHVSSAAFFVGSALFNLSGAVNVLLFLIIRPKLLLFAPPKKAQKPDLNAGPAIPLNTIQNVPGSEPTGMGPVGNLEEQPQSLDLEGSTNYEASNVSSRQRFRNV